MKVTHLAFFLLSLLLIFIIQVNSIQKDYTQFINTIKKKITQSPFKHSAYKRLAYISDTYGPRMWGSNQLETVIRLMKLYAEEQGFDNVRLQPVTNFTKWVRGKQQLTMLSPRPRPTKLGLIGLGGSVAGNITAEVLVVDDFDELQKKKSLVQGKIVLFNQKFYNYSYAGKYRLQGASRAAKYGAKAMILRSVTPFSIYSVHTGFTQYDPEYPKIPCAAITVQDSQMLRRMQDRGQKIILNLVMQNKFIEGVSSNNLVFDFKGRQKPDEYVIAGGHIDSWDTGSQTGALDDGGGFVSVYQALCMLKKLGYRPRRTIRYVAWSGEQSGSNRDGAQQYMERHIGQIYKYVAAFENDDGSNKLVGFAHSGQGQDIFKNVLAQYLSILNAGQFRDDGFNFDIQPLGDKGVPMINNNVKDTLNLDWYYKYHHTAGDSITIINPDDLDSNVVGIAGLLYILADLENSLRKVTKMLRINDENLEVLNNKN